MRKTLSTSRAIAHFGTTNECYRDLTARLSIGNVDAFAEFAKKEDPATFAKMIYAYIICGKFGTTRAVLRKRLKMDKEEFHTFLSDCCNKFVLYEKLKDKDDNPIPPQKVRIFPKTFPGFLTFEPHREGGEPQASRYGYKIDTFYYKDCYETWAEDDRMLATLGLACRLLPWLNQKYGFLCENPEEEWLDYIVPMKKKTIAEKLALPQRTADRYLAKMTTVVRRPIAQLNNLERDIVIAGDGKLKNGKKVFMLNPRLFYHKDTDPMIFFWKWGEDAEDLTIVDFDHESPIQRR